MASGEVMIWNMEDKEPVQILRGHGNRVADVAFSPSGGRFLASSDENGELIIWSTKVGSILELFKSFKSGFMRI